MLMPVDVSKTILNTLISSAAWPNSSILLWQATITTEADYSYCNYDKDIATGLGVGAILFLTASQLLIMVVSRCLCFGKALRPTGSRSCAIALFITSWYVVNPTFSFSWMILIDCIWFELLKYGFLLKLYTIPMFLPFTILSRSFSACKFQDILRYCGFMFACSISEKRIPHEVQAWPLM